MAKLNTFQQVRELEGWYASAFALTLVERMFPNYQLFCEATEFADANLMRNTLDALWDWLASPRSRINYEVQLLKVEEVTPDVDQFDNYGVYPALDFAVSLAALLNQMSGDDPQGGVVVSKISQGCVEAFIEATCETEMSSEAIRSHPLMQWELASQQAVLEYLQQKPQRNKQLSIELKDLATSEGISNIGIEI